MIALLLRFWQLIAVIIISFPVLWMDRRDQRKNPGKRKYK